MGVVPAYLLCDWGRWLAAAALLAFTMAPAPTMAQPPPPMDLKDLIELPRPVGIKEDRYCETPVVPTDPGKALEVVVTRLAADGFQSTANNLMSTLFGGLGGASQPPPQPAQEQGLPVWREALKRELRYVPWLPPGVERQMGISLYAQKFAGQVPSGRPKPGVAPKDEIAVELFRMLRSSLPAELPYDVEVKLKADTPGVQVDAVALPGGKILISGTSLPSTRPQADKLGPLELRALFTLAHELGHILKRHTTMRDQLMVWDVVDTAQTARDLIEKGEIPTHKIATVLELLQRADVGYSVVDEYEADACAVRFLVEAGLDVQMAADEFMKAVEGGKAAKKVGIWSTHPKAPDRRERIQEVINHYRGLKGLPPAAPAKAAKPRA